MPSKSSKAIIEVEERAKHIIGQAAEVDSEIGIQQKIIAIRRNQLPCFAISILGGIGIIVPLLFSASQTNGFGFLSLTGMGMGVTILSAGMVSYAHYQRKTQYLITKLRS